MFKAKHRQRAMSACAVVAVCCAIGCEREGRPGGAASTSPLQELELDPTRISAEKPQLVDEASPPPIGLRWVETQDGRSARTALMFDVENTTGTEIDVILRAITSGADEVERLDIGTMRVNPKSSKGVSIDVSTLGVQLVGASASTLVTAEYIAADGVPRVSALPSVWVEHDPGFKTARVRDSVAEARSNAARGIHALIARRPLMARKLDAGSRQHAAFSIDSAAVPGTALVEQLPELPDPVAFRASTGVHPDARTPDVSDAELSSNEPEVEQITEKGGMVRVCFRLPYWYVDANFGDDYLNGSSPTAEGLEPARYALFVLTNSAGQIIANGVGNLGTDGCTPLINHPDGIYTGWITSSLYRANSNVLIDVTADDTKQFVWASKQYQVSGSANTKYIDFAGAWPMTNATMMAQNTIFRAGDAYPAGTYTDIFIANTCPGDPMNSGCTSGHQIYLGKNNNGIWRADFKVVVGHELGHRVQDARWGIKDTTYSHAATQPLCNCNHVESSNQYHCLQSRETIEAAQHEGWGHFFAAKTLNDGAGASCAFAYYKEFMLTNMVVQSVPNSKTCSVPVRWRKTYCNSSTYGVSWDWTMFFWWLQNQQAYSFANFQSVYTTACGGNCGATGAGSTSWTALRSAAITAFGSSSPKAAAWNSVGSLYGVDL